MSINETVLEMHFHGPIMEAIRETFGLGDGAFNFYKYSPQREAFVGFDQAYVKTDLGGDDLFTVLRDRAQNHDYEISGFFFGYFLQFKVVKELSKRSKNTPNQVTSNPHYRSQIDTRCLTSKDYSQHHLLFNLSQNTNAFVYYACPMLFDRTALYQNPPDLETLTLVDVRSCSSAYIDNESHYIYFDQPDSSPIWCSEPIEGKSQTGIEWIKQLPELIRRDSLQDQLALLDNIEKLIGEALEKKGSLIPTLLEECFTIVEYRGHDVNVRLKRA